MSAFIFINTRNESNLASRVAHRHGYELSPDEFYKRYSSAPFSPWSSHQDARDAMEEIVDEIRADREAKRRPTRAEIAREEREALELTAHNICARTGRSYREIMRDLTS